MDKPISKLISSNFSPHYSEHVECDWCGQHTRGRVYEHKPDVVVCGSCGGLLLELPRDDGVKDDE